MINNLLKAIVDLTYGANRAKKNYLLAHPEAKILAIDGAKGIRTSEDKDLETGVQWVGARRAVIMLTDQRILCGDWNIALDTIERAELLNISSLFGQGQILKIQTTDHQHYQFGMQRNAEWTNQHVLPLTEKDAKMKVSTFSWIVRALALGYIIYWVLERFGLI